MKSIESKRIDLWDGGERHTFGFYISASVSDDAIKQAHQHCMITPCIVTVFESLQEVKENSVKELRKTAWRKLSPLERAALGLSLTEPY